MKIAIFTDTFLPSVNGVVTSECNLIKGLVAEGHEVIVFAPGEETKMENYEGARVYLFDSYSFFAYPDIMVTKLTEIDDHMKTILTMEQPDIYHVESPFNIGIAGLYFSRKFKKPIVITHHTDYENYSAYLTKGKAKKVMRYLVGKPGMRSLKVIYGLFNKVIAPSKITAKKLKDINVAEVTVISNGVDLEKFKGKKVDIRKKHKIPKNAKVLLYLGRVGFEKRLDTLVNAFKKHDKKAYLVICGSGPYLEKIKQLAKKIEVKNVIFAGYVPDEEIYSYYNEAYAFVSASDTETAGMTFIEAFASGTPAVGSDTFGSGEYVKDNKTGYRFKAGDIEDLADKIGKILENPKKRNEMAKEAKKFAQKFSIEKTTKKTIRLYKSLTDSPKGFKQSMKDALYFKSLEKLQKALKRALSSK